MAVPIQSVMHVNVNCARLETSLRFYSEGVGLAPESHTNPVPQDGSGFGLTGEVVWDAYILHDARGFGGPGLDLLEWKQPEPVGRPPVHSNALGFSRIALGAPDIHSIRERLIASGLAAADDLVDVEPTEDGSGRALLAHDPDGTLIEFVERPSLDSLRFERAVLNCSDLADSQEWYERVLGMQVRGEGAPSGVARALPGIAGRRRIDQESRTLMPAGLDEFAVELVEWRRPEPEAPLPDLANRMGIYRMAFMVQDMRECYDELRAQGVECPPPVYLDMGPDIPIDGLWAVFFPDPDGACLELIETPRIHEGGAND